MRQEDKDEIWHAARALPLRALTDGLQASHYTRTVLLKGKVVAIFGVAGLKGRDGFPWMLASPLLTKIRKPFLRECKEFVDHMQSMHPTLRNYAWVNNTEHIRWLKWLGFKFLVPQPIGKDGELFVEFYKVT